ncbi:HAD family hydrolase [Bifidobacterium choloepi]|uniref:HAD family phosphatase n=1 Tax=Bifidobacterium choloepi TaxID=2614131 RepID=A0A6I5ND66_9BIFI|nr:HAD family phosphatase [Bifidobacterium choloepi]NEG69394.1 HAD family phosphatase [Bifidobacterium choloepi]
MATGWPGEPDMAFDVIVADGEAAANDGKPVTDVVFDFGNVLVRWDPSAVMVSRYGRDLADDFLDNDKSGFYDACNMLDLGTDRADVYRAVAGKHGRCWADMLKFYLENFEDSLLGNVPGARLLVRDLKDAGIGVWGLSNWETTTFRIADSRYPLLRELDGRLISGFVGMIKPHADIFRQAFEDFGIEPATSLFVDDKASNVAGANAVGMRGLRFDDPRALRTALVDAGVPIPALEH